MLHPARIDRRLMAESAAALLLLISLTLVKTYPLIHHLGTHLPMQHRDSLHFTWLMAWESHALATDPWNLFNANLDYPAAHALAFTDHAIGLLPFFAPIYLLTANPVLAYNAVFLLSFPLCGMAMFFLIRHWTRSFPAALLAACLYGFALVRFGHLYHVNLLTLFAAPLALLFLDKFVAQPSWRHLITFAFFYWWQVLLSAYLGWMTTVAVICFLTYHVFRVDRAFLTCDLLTKTSAFIILSILVLVPVNLPYFQVSREWDYVRSLDENVHWSADLFRSYLSVPPLLNEWYVSLLRFAPAQSPNDEQWLFPGLVFICLATLAWLPQHQGSIPERLKPIGRALSFMLLTAFILSLGPYLIIWGTNTRIPLPYLALYQWAPTFNAMRVPARFAFLVSLVGCVLAAIGFLKLSAYLQARLFRQRLAGHATQVGLALAFLGLFILELGLKPLPLLPIKTGHEVPPVYRWLAAWSQGPIAEVPARFWKEFYYEYYSTYHWLPIIHGRGGYIPGSYFQVHQQAAKLPSKASAEFLSAIGVRAVVVHWDQLTPAEAAIWTPAAAALAGLQQIASFEEDTVYQLPQVSPTHILNLTGFMPPRLPVATSVTLKLFARGEREEPWAHPLPPRLVSVTNKWTNLETGNTTSTSARVQFPLAIESGAAHPLGIIIPTPSTPGRYDWQWTIPDWGLGGAPQTVTLAADIPTSLSSTERPKAIYALPVPLPPTVDSSGNVMLSVTVQNAGMATWLATAQRGNGHVQLGWRWRSPSGASPLLAGALPLPHDVSPGETGVVQASLPTPSEPGVYALVLDLFVTIGRPVWFSELGVAPLTDNILVQ